MFLLYKDSLQKKHSLEKRKAEVVRKSLPGFNNQLLLLLNSGLIFYDAFGRIAEGYERRQDDADVKSSEPIKEGGEVYYPGELELKNIKENKEQGIPVIEEVWESILKM